MPPSKMALARLFPGAIRFTIVWAWVALAAQLRAAPAPADDSPLLWVAMSDWRSVQQHLVGELSSLRSLRPTPFVVAANPSWPTWIIEFLVLLALAACPVAWLLWRQPVAFRKSLIWSGGVFAAGVVLALGCLALSSRGPYGVLGAVAAFVSAWLLPIDGGLRFRAFWGAAVLLCIVQIGQFGLNDTIPLAGPNRVQRLEAILQKGPPDSSNEPVTGEVAPANVTFNNGWVVFNPFWAEYWATLLYIAAGVVAVIPGRTRFGNPNLCLVLLCYLGVGTAFGALFHNLYVARIAASNTLAVRHAVRVLEALRQKTNPNAVKPLERLKKDFAIVIDGSEPAPNDSISESRAVLAYLRNAPPYFAEIAKDEPHPDSSLPLVESAVPLFAESVQFREGEKLPFDGLPLLFRHPFSSGQEKEDRMVTTNIDVAVAFQAFLQRIQSGTMDRDDYSIVFHGGADIHLGVPNLELARQRCGAMRSWLLTYVDRKAPAGNGNLKRLAAVLHQDPACHVQVQGPDPADLATLWPNVKLPAFSHGRLEVPQEFEAWKAASVVIWKATPVDSDSGTVSMHLAKEMDLMDMMYFSFASFTTTGYGDMRPTSLEARFLAVLENILELIFTSVFFATAMNTGREREKEYWQAS